MKPVTLSALLAVAAAMTTLPVWGQTAPPSPSAAARPDSPTAPNLQNLQPRIQAIRDAPDPSAAIDAYAQAQALAPADPAAQAAFIERMVLFNLPEMAEVQARDLARQEPNYGLAWGVLAYTAGKRGHIDEALADLTAAYRLAPDQPFIQRTAGQLLAWYDANGARVKVPAPTLAGVVQMQKDLQDKPAYADAYRLAAQIYQEARAEGPGGPGTGHPGGRPWGNPALGGNPVGIPVPTRGTAHPGELVPSGANEREELNRGLNPGVNPGAYGVPTTMPAAAPAPDAMAPPVPSYDYPYYSVQGYNDGAYPPPSPEVVYETPPVYVEPPYDDNCYWWPTYSCPVIVGPFYTGGFGSSQRFHHDRDVHEFHEHWVAAPAPGVAPARGLTPGAVGSVPRFTPGLSPGFTPGFRSAAALPAPTVFSSPGYANAARFFSTTALPPVEHWGGPAFEHRGWNGSGPQVGMYRADPPPAAHRTYSSSSSGGGGGGGHSGGGGGGGRHR